MKKKNLIILLLLPFLISVFCIVTINTTYNMIDVDISGIDWKYKDMEGFKISDSGYKLEAVGVNQRNYAVSDGNELIWSVENRDPLVTDPCAEIKQENGAYYLYAKNEGEVIITCSNEKGNVQRRLSAIIYETAAILIYPKISASQTNIDPTVYYGEYDHRIGNSATIEMTLVAIGADKSSLEFDYPEDKIFYNRSKDEIDILAPGEVSLRITDKGGMAKPTTFSFTVVDEGVNVYNYDDLLYCAGSSGDGHIAVLRKHFESLENMYEMDGRYPVLSGGKPVRKNTANNVECFGKYDPVKRAFNFKNEIYSFTTTYNKEFIDGWNEFVKSNKGYSTLSDKVYAGLRVQKDFYGNGYTVNLHNLTYPYSYSEMINENGDDVRIPELTSENLYRGPLKLYSLGDPNNVPLVSLYGQDNVGMYVNGDNITVNDVNLKSCDFGNRMANLDTVGTVLENYGWGNTVKNCRISNGKNVVRSFSSMNFTLENSLLSNARNFLFVTGSNEYEKVNMHTAQSLPTALGGNTLMTIKDYLKTGAPGDEVINKFIKQSFSTPAERELMRAQLMQIQNALNQVKEIENDFHGTTVIKDTYFYRSGICAVCMESLFNSSFLESGEAPSIIGQIFSALQSEGKSLIPYTPTGVSGVSYPVLLTMSGECRFYDYKEEGNIDLSGLIEENISAIANSLGLYEGTVTIDKVFPLQTMLIQKANANRYAHHSDGKRYYNAPVAYYGGGLNLSRVAIDLKSVSDSLEVDMLDSYLTLAASTSGGQMANVKNIMLKTVITVTGFEPFSFHFVTGGYLFGETPNISDLILRASGSGQ